MRFFKNLLRAEDNGSGSGGGNNGSNSNDGGQGDGGIYGNNGAGNNNGSGNSGAGNGGTNNNADGKNNENTGEKIDWNSDNWKSFLDKDIFEDQSLHHIKDIKTLAKSYVHGQKMIGAEKLVIPGKLATEQDWEQVFNKLGRPESAEKYDIKMPESKFDDKFSNGLKAAAHKAGLNNGQAQKLFDFYGNQLKEIETEMANMNKAENDKQLNALKTEWGPAFNNKVQAAAHAIKEYGGDEALNYINDNYPYDATLARMFAKIGEGMKEQGATGGANSGFAITPADAKKQYNTIMGDKGHPYWNSKHPSNGDALEEVRKLRKIFDN